MVKTLRSPWGDLVLFVLFLVFLVLVFPPLVRRLWGCKPLPPGPLRQRLAEFCHAQGFYSKLYSWPLFEGQVLTAAISEQAWDLVRAERDRRIALTDHTQAPDSPLSAEKRAAFAAYRQALRDIPQTYVSPADVDWPVPPALD